MSREFVDTNVILYAYDVSDPQRHRPARSLMRRLAGDGTGALSVQVMQEFFVNATRKLQQPLSHHDAREALSALATWSVHSPLPRDVIAATTLAEEVQLSFWDAMIVQSAVVLGCSTLWSEDLNPGQTIQGVTIKNPFDPETPAG